MAEEEERKVLGFHEMGLDDRLLKVNRNIWLKHGSTRRLDLSASNCQQLVEQVSVEWNIIKTNFLK